MSIKQLLLIGVDFVLLVIDCLGSSLSLSLSLDDELEEDSLLLPTKIRNMITYYVNITTTFDWYRFRFATYRLFRFFFVTITVT